MEKKCWCGEPLKEGENMELADGTDPWTWWNCPRFEDGDQSHDSVRYYNSTGDLVREF
jgi:hypothetical protein